MVYINYTLVKLTYQLSTLRFTNLFAFDIIGSYFRYTIAKGMVNDIFTTILLGETFPMVS